MANETEIWKPGSFTKNFSWGNMAFGLRELYEIIRFGFNETMGDVPRVRFRERIADAKRPDYIPINFFLFNKNVDGVDCLCADELVFQALKFPHSARFDKLALFAFNLSIVGKWSGARPEQRRPALWANAYVREHLSGVYGWNTQHVSAVDIQRFVGGDPRYKAQTTRKLGTNLNYMFQAGRLRDFPTRNVERWWVDCLFLALDRIIEDRLLDRRQTQPQQYPALLKQYGFYELTGNTSLEKELAANHLCALYDACGGLNRFSEEATRERINVLSPESFYYAANDPRPRGAVHLTNPRVLKSIPAACAMLAKYAGFEDLSPDELEEFNLEAFVKRRTQEALAKLREQDIKPTMTAEEILRITRGQ